MYIVKEAGFIRDNYPGGGSYYEATWRTIYANRGEIGKDAEALRAFADVFQFDRGSHESEVPKELEQVVAAQIHNFQTFATNRVLYWTERGYIGLGPLDIQVGDRLAIFCAGLAPYIIRKEIKEWRFIGET
jgi:hypothetical protein